MVVSMRPFRAELVQQVIEITTRFGDAHGAPVQHDGNYSALDIKDLAKPDFGDAVTVKQGEIPVFWACGVTPQLAIARAKPPFAITHAPGCMFVTDLRAPDFQ